MTGSYVLDSATQAMVASLDSQEERDRLTRFLTVELQDGKGTGILGDVFLLLKANRCYMEKLPARFNRELVQPIEGHTLRMEKTFAAQIDTQKQIATQNERTTTRSIGVMDRMDSIIPKVENVVQRSVDRVDTKALTQQITETLFESTVEPVRMTNLELMRMANVLTDLIDKAKKVFDMLRKIAWRQILLGSLGVTFVFWAVIFFFVYLGMQHSFETSLQTARTEQNQKLLDLSASLTKALDTGEDNRRVVEKLSHLQVTTDVKSVADGPNHYAFTITKAYDAKVLPDGTGVIDFQGPDLNQLIEQEIKENEKLMHH